MNRLFWGLVCLLSVSLLGLFFSFPLARFIFAPLCLAAAAAGYFHPRIALVLFLLATVTTLQIPIILGLPYFSGPEPIFLALCFGYALRRLLARSPELALNRTIGLPLILYGCTVVASGLLVWVSLWDLPSPWLSILSLDSLSKIFFWRWRNPFHFLRIELLYLEGIVAFLLTFQIVRADPERTLRWAALGFAAAGALVVGYSFVDLFVRGKQITVYPGYGAVFTDRNAYAAFWILLIPVAAGLILTGRQAAARWAAGALTACAVLLLLASLSFSGVLTLGFSAPMILILLFREQVVSLRLQRRFWPLLAVLVLMTAAAAGIWLALDNPKQENRLQTRLTMLWERGLLDTLYEDRARPWRSATAMLADHPLLGIGVGEFFKQYEVYSQRFRELPQFEYPRQNAHNYFLQLAAGMGLFGIGSFLLIVIGILRLGGRYRGSGESQTLVRAFLAAILGLLFFSIAQHPMLRFEFQACFWIFAGLIAGASAGVSQPARHQPRTHARPAGWAAGAVALAALVQFWLFPLPPRDRIEYGLHSARPGQGPVMTEGEAFLRFPPSASSQLDFRIRPLPNAPPQEVQFQVNDRTFQVKLTDAGWVRIREPLIPGRRIDLGIRVRPVISQGFANSWGRGIVLEKPEP